MKFGIKIWSTNNKLIECAKSEFSKNSFDFIELSAITNSFNKSILSNLQGIPTVIHCDNNNVSFANKKLYQENVEATRESQKFADFLDSKYIILHPGHNGTIENVNDFLSSFNDDRFCIENMPGKTVDLKYYNVGRTYEEIKKINIHRYCLDLSHAVKSAITLNLDVFENIRNLLKLNPEIFHISDGVTDNEVDEHLNIGEGNYNIGKIIDLIGRDNDKYITLETPKENYDDLDVDILNVKRLKEFF